jgi:cysteine desulfurase
MSKYNNNIHAGFFDYASATPLDANVLESMMPFLRSEFYNPSALYSAADKPKKAIESARSQVASVLGVRANEIIFTAGCTEANNIAINGVMAKYPGKKLLISAIEHDSVSEPAGQYQSQTIPLNSDGEIILSELDRLIDDEVVMVSIIYASNEIGTVQDLRAISKIIAAKKLARNNGLPLYLHTDAAQAANYLSLNCHSLGVDMMSLNGGKMYGPKASGCLYVSKEIKLKPFILGGGQEQGLRSGTENVPSIVGFAIALSNAASCAKQSASDMYKLRKEFVGKLGLKTVVSPKEFLPNILSIDLGTYDNERMVMELDKKGFSISSGSACHARGGIASRVLSSIGLSSDKAHTIVRISMGKYTDTEDVQNLVSNLLQILALI